MEESENNFTVVSRLLEGEFFKYENSFINEYRTSIDINRLNFLNAIERATLIVKDSKKSPVELEIKNNANKNKTS